MVSAQDLGKLMTGVTHCTLTLVPYICLAVGLRNRNQT